MQTHLITTYSFNELSDTAKQTAIENYRNNITDYFWSSEWLESLNIFCDQLDISLEDYSINAYGYAFVKWNYIVNETIDCDDLKGLRLRTWLINNWLPILQTGKYYFIGEYRSRNSKIQFEYNNCPLTGFCGDNSLIQPILDFIKTPDNKTNLDDVINSCMNSFITDFNSDCKYNGSDEFITETIEINDYEFNSNGSFY